MEGSPDSGSGKVARKKCPPPRRGCAAAANAKAAAAQAEAATAKAEAETASGIKHGDAHDPPPSRLSLPRIGNSSQAERHASQHRCSRLRPRLRARCEAAEEAASMLHSFARRTTISPEARGRLQRLHDELSA